MKHRAVTSDTEDVAWVQVDGPHPIYHGPIAAGMGLVVAEFLVDEYQQAEDGGIVWNIDAYTAAVDDQEGRRVSVTGIDRTDAWRNLIGRLLAQAHGPCSTKGFPVHDTIQSVLN
jgi:hypothetical protein